jgi:hypothetical protein
MRRAIWVGSYTEDADTWYFPYKYKIRDGSDPLEEYAMVLRLGEQILIRAEARARQDNLAGAISDINMIRERAQLPLIIETDPTMDLANVLLAIEKERRSELFCEWGDRWFDLKRNDRLSAVLGPIKTGWALTDAFYPIPQTEILVNRNLDQNPGY